MDLVVDIGNTKTKVAAFQKGKLIADREIFDTIDDDTRISIELLKPSTGIISSVAGDTKSWLQTFPQIQWIELSRQLKLPVTIDYETPETLGLDRIALASAAAHVYPNKNVLVIDAGTCVTYDVITANATFVGGAISPGLTMRLKAMNHFTARLPLAEVDAGIQVLGKSTMGCLQAGALHGLAAEIDGLITRYSAQFEDVLTVVTGGDAIVLAPLIKNNIFAHPKFLLQGLHAILAYNTP